MGVLAVSTSGTQPPDARVAGWVERSCLEQGVPVKASDPLTIRKLLALLDAGSSARLDGVGEVEHFHQASNLKEF